MRALAGEVTLENFESSLRALDSPANAEKCPKLLESSRSQNSAQLFYSAAVCNREKRNDDAAFFMLAGQVRSTADRELYEHVSVKSEARVGTSYALIFSRFGGPGDVSIYRDPARYEARIARVVAWVPSQSDSYNPGWQFKASPANGSYKEAISAAKQHRRMQLEGYSRLIRDDLYFFARQGLVEIQLKTQRGIAVGKTEGKRIDDLMKQMQEREERVRPGDWRFKSKRI